MHRDGGEGESFWRRERLREPERERAGEPAMHVQTFFAWGQRELERKLPTHCRICTQSTKKHSIFFENYYKDLFKVQLSLHVSQRTILNTKCLTVYFFVFWAQLTYKYSLKQILTVWPSYIKGWGRFSDVTATTWHVTWLHHQPHINDIISYIECFWP